MVFSTSPTNLITTTTNPINQIMFHSVESTTPKVCQVGRYFNVRHITKSCVTRHTHTCSIRYFVQVYSNEFGYRKFPGKFMNRGLQVQPVVDNLFLSFCTSDSLNVGAAVVNQSLSLPEWKVNFYNEDFYCMWLVWQKGTTGKPVLWLIKQALLFSN